MVKGVKDMPYIIGSSFYPIQTYSQKKIKIHVDVEIKKYNRKMNKIKL
jgi:hypothetical protein